MFRPVYLLLLFFLLLYLLFPTSNSTLDAWYYAACVKHGRDLFLPHHLLYNAAGYLAFGLLKGLGMAVDALAMLKVLNAVIATACLWVLHRIMRERQYPQPAQTGWLLVAGASFGVWRFATENEVYLLPILLSLGGSYFWLRQLQTGRVGVLVLAGFLAALACLFHQIQVFWWLGLLVGCWWAGRSLRALFAFGMPALLVPVVYALVLVYAEQQRLHPEPFMRFVLHDFYSGTAGSSIGLNNFLLTGISLVRTFVQVHGQMLYLVQKSWLWFLPAIVSLGLVAWGLAGLPFSGEKPSPHVPQRHFEKVHLLILVLHVLFAWFAVGNAEFMVMVPFLLPLMPWLRLPAFFLKRAGMALLVWNFAYGIFPAWHYRFSASDALAQHALHHPGTLFILSDALEVNNRYFYHFGTDPAPNVEKSPSLRAQRNQDAEELKTLIARHLNSGRPVLTDCLRKPRVITRSSMVVNDLDSVFFSSFRTAPVDSFATFYGWQYLHRLVE